MTLEVGQVFAGYRILRALGAGGMGQVYLASHPRLPREDALKVLPSDLTGDAEYRARFLREADVAADLAHPSIVAIHDRGEYDGQFWISMDYVAGTDAAQLVQQHYPGGMPLAEVAAIVGAIASALDYAHHRGLLHRDVKPANILLTDADRPGQSRRAFLADFGIARRVDDSGGLTATNAAIGTAAYAAPEQLLGEAIDGRADQYALACTAFHLLSGCRPYDHSNIAVVISQHVTAPPPSIAASRPDLAWLDPVFGTALAKDPADRFANCSDFAAQLGRNPNNPYQPATRLALPVSAPPPRRRHRRRRTLLIAALVAAALLAVAGGVIAVVMPDRRTGPGVTAGPFDGVYRADIGPIIGFDDTPQAGAPPAVTNTYGLRSACGSTGCVATATRLSGVLGAETMVFDKVGERWQSVSYSTAECGPVSAGWWHIATLQPLPNGTLAGDYVDTSDNVCATRRTLTLTRVGDLGDLDAARVADPATQPRRVAAPAEAFRGRYRSTRTFANGNPALGTDGVVTTACLRTGDHCLSSYHAKSTDAPLVFADGAWALTVHQAITCPHTEDVTSLVVTGQYPLPQPLQDPLPRLNGHGHQEQTGTCTVNTDFDETFTRTGD